MPRSTPDIPRVSRARSSPLTSVPPRPPTRARSGDAGTLEELKRSTSPREGSSSNPLTAPSSMPSPGGGNGNRSSQVSMPSPGGNRSSSTTSTPRRNMSNRQRLTQLAAIELNNSISQMSASMSDLNYNDSNSSLQSMEGSIELNLNDVDDAGTNTAEASSSKHTTTTTNSGVPETPSRGRKGTVGSSTNGMSNTGHTSASSGSGGSSSRHQRRMDRERTRKGGSLRENSQSRHRRTVDRDAQKSSSSSLHRRSIDKESNSDGSDEQQQQQQAVSSSLSPSPTKPNRGRSRRGGDGGGDSERQPRSTSRSRRDRSKGRSTREGGDDRSGRGGSRSRSKSRGPRSKSVNARSSGGRSRRGRGGGGGASNSNWKSPMSSPFSDEEQLDKSDPLLVLPAPSLSLDTASKSEAGIGFDNSTRSKVSEADIMDFLTTPRPTRKQGDRQKSSADRKDSDRRDRERDRDRDRDSARRDRRDRRDRDRDRRTDTSPNRRRERSPTRKSGSRSPVRSSSADRLSPSDGQTSRSRSDTSSKVRNLPPRTKSNDSTLSRDSSKGLGDFLALPNRRSKSVSGSRSVASSPAGVARKGRRRKPASARSSGSNTSSDGELDPESSESYEEETPVQQQQQQQPKSMKEIGQSGKRRPPRKTPSAEDLGTALGLKGDRKKPDSAKRSTPRRTKSSDSYRELSAFLAQPGGRRKPPAGGGSRSVASSPANASVSKSRKKKQLEEINNNYQNSEGKASSTTITTEETAAAEESDSDQESVSEDMLAMNHKSFRDLEKERQMQKHLNRTDDLLYSVFPKHIAEALRAGKKVEPENHECVTIFFSDIVGFTDISSSLDPLKISDMLDRLYNSFDTLSHYHDVFKVETIGDAYMAVTNLTKEQPDHCKRIAMFAMDAIRVANQTAIDMDDPSRGNVNIRVGFHSGPVVSNVVGSRNPRYCLFGDTVNTASRMESNSEVNRIHCSEDSAKILQAQHPEIRLASRGAINVKGKGKMSTYWVNEDEGKNTGNNSGENSFAKTVFSMMGKRYRRGSM